MQKDGRRNNNADKPQKQNKTRKQTEDKITPQTYRNHKNETQTQTTNRNTNEHKRTHTQTQKHKRGMPCSPGCLTRRRGQDKSQNKNLNI